MGFSAGSASSALIVVARERVRLTAAAAERQGREGRKEILYYFATSAFHREVLYQIHESSGLADGAEGEPLCAQCRDQSRGRINSLTLILERRRLVAVVHHHDVAIADAMPDPVHNRIRRP